MSASEEPAKICSACLTGAILEGTPTGTMSTINGMPYYVAEGTEAKKAIILCCDIFGLGISNPKLLADTFTKSTGFTCYVPDLLEGEYANPAKLSLVEQPIAEKPFLARLSATASMISSFMLNVGPLFLYKHRPGRTVPLLIKFIDDIKKEKSIEAIGVVGYCFGGVQVITLAGTSPSSAQVVVCAHPGPLSLSDFEKVTVPLSIIAAQEDMSFEGTLAKGVKKLLETKADGEFVEYAGTCHGFAARPLLSDPVIKIAFEGSLKQTTDFFKKHL